MRLSNPSITHNSSGTTTTCRRGSAVLPSQTDDRRAFHGRAAQGGPGAYWISRDIIRQHERFVLISGLDMPSGKSPAGSDSHPRQRLTHRQIVKDSSLVGNAGADYLLVFRKRGENKELIRHAQACKNIAGRKSH